MPTPQKIDVEFDRRMMAAALRLGLTTQGRAHPNPAVGCIIVRDAGEDRVVVGSGATAPGGRPHAERIALAEAGEAARGATAYVTLEPCAHESKAGPCAGCAGSAEFLRLQSKLTTCLSGSRLAKDRAADTVSKVMIPAALDYPAAGRA